MQAFLALILVIGFAFECYIAHIQFHQKKKNQMEKEAAQRLLKAIHDQIMEQKRRRLR